MINMPSFKKLILNSLTLTLFATFSCSQTPRSNVQKVNTSPPPQLINNTVDSSGSTTGVISDTSTAPDSNLNNYDYIDHSFSNSSNYNLEKPNQVCNLPKELLEISALGYDSENQKLITVNDEKANFYLLNMENCEVATKHDFGKKGDYEGIESVDQTIYVINSAGDIFAINPNTLDKSQKYKTPLSATNDVEGLGYDESKNELILACKGAPNLGKKSKLKKAKAFYSFNLGTKELDKKPKFVIKDKDLINFFKEMPKKSISKKAKKKLENRLESFSPSGIAKHPIDGYYYILSSVGRLLIVSNDEGDIQAIHFLKPKMFAQPEGICFSPDGTLYISNEGRSLVAKIMVFNYES